MIIILRSMLGGFIGGLLTVLSSALSYQIWLGYIPYPALFVFQGIPLALFDAVLAAISIGIPIRFLYLKFNNLNIFIRMAIGVVAFWILQPIIFGINGNNNTGYVEPFTPTLRTINSIITVLALGVLPGAMAYQKDNDAT